MPSFSAVTDPGRRQATLGLLQRDAEDRCARLQQAGIARNIGDDRRIGSDDHLSLAALVGYLQHLTLRRRGDDGHRGIGHQAIGDQARRTR
jgi:hypothetical protein